MEDNINIDTLKLIAKVGIIIGQANPNKDVDTLVDSLDKVLVKARLNQLVDA